MNNHQKIPFNKPFIVGKELYNIAQAVIKNGQLSGDGQFTKMCQELLENKLCCNKTLLTHSCTAALEMAAILIDIKPGDEFIVPSYTFVSTINAFVLRGGVPVFIDIRSDTLNIDETLIKPALSKKTKAIVPVHYAGVPAEMNQIMAIAKENQLFVIEDAAQALLSRYNGKHLGTIGDLGTLSFHETKNVISGEGGALIINNQRFIERAEVIWQKGTNRKQFIEKKIDKYNWVDIGSSFLPSELVSAFLYAQLQEADTINRKRKAIIEKYLLCLKPLLDDESIILPFVNNDHQPNGHLFYIITRSCQERIKLIEYLEKYNIQAVFHYVPLHSSPAGLKYGKTFGKLTKTDQISERLLRLPIYYEMSFDEVERVSSIILDFYKK